MSSEKVSFNISVVDLGKIEMLVDRGVYTNRTDFITKALVHELSKNEDVIQQFKKDYNWAIGIQVVSKKEIEQCIKDNKKMKIYTLGMLIIDKGVTLEEAIASIESITVFGKFKASDDIKDYFKS